MTNKELISKSEVEKTLKRWFPMHGHGENYYFIEEIKSLPTFSPEAIIDELQEKYRLPFEDRVNDAKLDVLSELRARIRAENIS